MLGGVWNFRLFVGFGLSVGGWILIRRKDLILKFVLSGPKPYLVGGHFRFLVGFGLSVRGLIV